MMTNFEQGVAIAARRYFERQTAPDWEQRRYEIAKDVLAAQFSGNNPVAGSYKYLAADAVECADALIEALRGGN